MGRIEGKIDSILENQNEFKSTFEKHDTRLKQLEGHQMKTMGFVGAIVFALNWVLQYFTQKIH